jgi:hypothetical protein
MNARHQQRSVARRLTQAAIATAVVLAALVPPLASHAPVLAIDCSKTSTGRTPLSDTNDLYEGGNTMPAAHAQAAPEVKPIGGTIGVISLGMSNGKQEWASFMDSVQLEPIADSLRFANGAVSGQTMAQWADPTDDAWSEALSAIQQDGMKPSDVQVVWMKMGSRVSDLVGSQAARVEQERAWLETVIENAKDVFPNLARIYISSRIYVGYETSPNHAEPLTGYDNGLSVRAIVDDSVNSKTAVWTAWGPYLWADGTTPRNDGLTWECGDFENDGVHPSKAGEQKVADALLEFFSNDPSACEWYLADPSTCGGGAPPPRPPQPPPPQPPPVPLEGHTPGLVDTGSGKWYLYDGAGKLDTSFYFGNPGDFPIYGDWDGDGIETPGLYRQSDGFVYLRNSNTQGIADIKFFFGNPGDVPIAGDFNGDGKDTVSIYRPSNQTFYIINKLGANNGGLGAAETSYIFGNPGDKPFVGDFDGDGIETVGLHRESTGLVYYRNSHTQGIADNQFIFGNPGDRFVAGDWTNDGVFTPGLYRPSNATMFFKYTNTQGNADNQFIPVPNSAGWIPVSGNRP